MSPLIFRIFCLKFFYEAVFRRILKYKHPYIIDLLEKMTPLSQSMGIRMHGHRQQLSSYLTSETYQNGKLEKHK